MTVTYRPPPKPTGWDPTWTHTGRLGQPPATPPVTWRDCRGCWGQGRIYHQSQAPAVMWRTCPTCLGTGSEWR